MAGFYYLSINVYIGIDDFTKELFLFQPCLYLTTISNKMFIVHQKYKKIIFAFE